MSGSGFLPASLEPRRSADAERADTLEWIDRKIAVLRRHGEDAIDSRHRFEALRDELAAGLHERAGGEE
jgi:hypothetical protein